MRPLNYHHLQYFWMVAREGTVTAACKKLSVAQPTVSAQIRSLEESLGKKLFTHVGRTLELTETGQMVYRYAEDIFALGAEMLDTLDGRPVGSRMRLRVGVADVLPKMLVARALQPAIEKRDEVHLLCFEGKPTELLAKLSLNELDLVLSDSPVGSDANVRAFNHQVGECDVAVFAPRRQAAKFRSRFPQSLDGAPFFLPTENTAMRRMINYWFAARDIQPCVVAEFEDSALLKAFSRSGRALFPAPALIEAEVERLYKATSVGRLESLRERFYAISLERKVKHPIVQRIIESGQEHLFLS